MKATIHAVAMALLVSGAARGAPNDVVPAPQQTDVGGSVFVVGTRPLHVAAGRGVGSLVILGKQGVVLADSGGAIDVFDLTTGKLVRTLEPAKPPERPDDRMVELAVTADGTSLAGRQGYATRVWRWPFDKPAYIANCIAPCATSHDGKLFACSGPEIWEFSTGKRIAGPPPGDAVPMNSCAFSGDDHSLILSGTHAITRWDFATSKAAPTIFESKDNIAITEFARSADRAIVIARPAGSYKRHATLVELGSGKATALPGDTYVLSPSGKLAASETARKIDIIELSTGKTLATIKLTDLPGPMAFAEGDRLFAYVDGHDIRIADLPAGSTRTIAPASRFAGWVGPASAAIELGADLFALALPARTWVATDRKALVAALPGAPSWATWTSGDVAAAPSHRHELRPQERDESECDRTLKVWTAKGGARTLVTNCSKDDAQIDPGWEIGGGWAVSVGVSSVAIFDPKTGKRLATLPALPPAVRNKPTFVPSYYAMALSPGGDRLAVMWRSAIPRNLEERPPQLRGDVVADDVECAGELDGCKQHYTIDIWTIAAHPKRLSRVDLDATPTGVLAFDHTGAQLVVGFDTGEIRVLSDAGQHSELLHTQRIERISVAPGDGWVFSEDDAHEQRIWALP